MEETMLELLMIGGLWVHNGLLGFGVKSVSTTSHEARDPVSEVLV